MSQRLTPEQQREMAVRMGCEVQNLNDMVSGFCCEPLAPVAGMDLSREDKLRISLVEAACWIRKGAPARALETLERAMQL